MSLRDPLLALLLCATTTACGADDGSGRPSFAFVTNQADPFWSVAGAGVEAAAADFDVSCEVRTPASGTVEEQKRILEELLTLERDGIAITPIDPENQRQLIDEACERTLVITHDSDAPGSDRLCYVGVDNYRAGRMCGELVKEALPEGGTVMIFVGRLEQDNAKKRRQGVIDELIGRAEMPEEYDPLDEVLAGGGYTILDTRTDQGDYSRAKANAEDALAVHGDLDCMVGLFAYNAPKCLEAVRVAGKEGEVQIVAFDEAEETLQGIVDGAVYGTVSQNPYMYGYESVRILAHLFRGDDSVIPAGEVVEVEARTVTRENVEGFWEELKARIAFGG